ncbi:MAG: hypothetical protein M8364_14620 [Methylobacter sp.]|uniref:hypothetical protein n=1 Tax=Methylobacter sp. TaxID=2051955 RepID=UPI00258A4A83|nr:hypothetical protein [Methylobacter sp.]MCL7422130.1 hypothetical protein [Methylobacter sp.]
MAIKKVSGTEARGRRGSTDWKKVKSMTDEEIKRAAMMDPEARELRNDELARFRKGNR